MPPLGCKGTTHERIPRKPVSDNLAILRSCRLVKEEIGDSWINQLLWIFQTTVGMLDTLITFPPEILSKLRHMHVFGDTVEICEDHQHRVYYRLASLFRFFPGLRLDTLTVLSLRSSRANHETLDSLVSEGCGWKQLRYISNDSEMLTFTRKPYPRNASQEEKKLQGKSQPAHWQSVLEDRDGALSRPSVAIYRSTVSDCPGSILNARNRVRFDQRRITEDYELKVFRKKENAKLMADGERGKEVMVVVNRGEGVNYEQTKDSPFLGRDLLQDMPQYTWPEIRHHYIGHHMLFARELDSDDEEDEADGFPYLDMDKDEWHPRHPRAGERGRII